MKLYLAGTEIPGHRALLADQGVSHVSMSFMGQRRRSKKVVDLSELFPDGQHIFLDSGAYTINQEDAKYTQAELKELAALYYELVEANIGRIDMFSEFDAKVLGPHWIEQMRAAGYEQQRDKFLPIWHPEDGLKALDELCFRFPRVGIMATEVNGRNITTTLNNLTRQYGTKLHGITMSAKEMQAVDWDSASTASWISPSRYGETIIWTGRELKHYPQKTKDLARRRHRTQIERAGFDADALLADDHTEALKLSIWSWGKFVEQINSHGATMMPEIDDWEEVETLSFDVAPTDPLVRNPGPVVVRERAERQLLPILGMRTQSDEDGEEHSTPFMRSSSPRQCNSCYLAARCPAVLADSNCAYDIPIQVRTKDQYRALYDAIIEMQAQRVMLKRFAEEVEGGPTDPDLSAEIKLLNTLIVKRHEMDQEGFTLNLQARAVGQTGMISRMFGRDAGQAVQALPTVIDADETIRSLTS